jgi:hypothetical protein
MMSATCFWDCAMMLVKGLDVVLCGNVIESMSSVSGKRQPGPHFTIYEVLQRPAENLGYAHGLVEVP